MTAGSDDAADAEQRPAMSKAASPAGAESLGTTDAHRRQPVGRSWVRVAAVLVGLVAAGLIALLATRDSDGGSIRAASPLIGELVPPLRGELIWPPESFLDAGGAQALPGVRIGPDDVARFDIDAVSLQSSNPRWVLVNFFASWCVPCEREHPALATWAARHSGDGVLVAVPFGDRTTDAVAFYERLGGDWSVVDDPDSRWAVEFGVLRPPESFLITPDGIVAARWQGQISADDPDAVIALLLGAASADAAAPPSPARVPSSNGTRAHGPLGTRLGTALPARVPSSDGTRAHRPLGPGAQPLSPS